MKDDSDCLVSRPRNSWHFYVKNYYETFLLNGIFIHILKEKNNESKNIKYNLDLLSIRMI